METKIESHAGYMQWKQIKQVLFLGIQAFCKIIPLTEAGRIDQRDEISILRIFIYISAVSSTCILSSITLQCDIQLIKRTKIKQVQFLFRARNFKGG